MRKIEPARPELWGAILMVLAVLVIAFSLPTFAQDAGAHGSGSSRSLAFFLLMY